MLRRSVSKFRGANPFLGDVVKEPQPGHYLLVHDAAKAFLPHSTVQANITNRRSFQAHMQVLVDDAFDFTRIPSIAADLQKHLTSGVVEPRANDYGMTIRFYDDTVMSVMLGRPDVTVEKLLQTDDEALRILYRASLGCDENMYRRSLKPWIHECEIHCIRIQNEMLGERFKEAVPRVYWLAICNYLASKYRDNVPIRIARYATSHLTEFDWELPNPLLPQEDLNQLPSVCELRQMSSGMIQTHYDKQPRYREVNIVGEGTVPTQEEYEQLLIDKGILEPPAPKRPGFFARLFGAAEPELAEGAPKDPHNVESAARSSEVRVPEGASLSPGRRVKRPSGGYSYDGDISSQWVEMGRRRYLRWSRKRCTRGGSMYAGTRSWFCGGRV
jgi:hypothetical protein